MCLTQFLATSDKRQATSDKRQATSDKRQSGINSAQINLNINYSNHAQRQAVGQRPLFCPWAFFIHRLIKPQRTQSVELRSTSQRNNRNVLRIGTNSIQKYRIFPEPFNRPGFLRAEPLSSASTTSVASRSRERGS